MGLKLATMYRDVFSKDRGDIRFMQPCEGNSSILKLRIPVCFLFHHILTILGLPLNPAITYFTVMHKLSKPCRFRNLVVIGFLKCLIFYVTFSSVKKEKNQQKKLQS